MTTSASGDDRFSVRPFTADEWQVYKSVRLEALRDSPDAFATTYAESVGRDDNQWRERLKVATSEASKQLPLAVFEGERVVGQCWVIQEEDDSSRANVIQMWVAPAFRGLGLSRRLLLATIEWATQNSVEVMTLGVTQGETPARRLYESVGFQTIGSEPLREGSSLRVDNMALQLQSRGDVECTHLPGQSP
ncbi:MAG: GNAT family N-acetyltransferase [Pseudomonadota bacterium]